METRIIIPFNTPTSNISVSVASGARLRKKLTAENPTKPTISNVEKCNLIFIPLIVPNLKFFFTSIIF